MVGSAVFDYHNVAECNFLIYYLNLVVFLIHRLAFAFNVTVIFFETRVQNDDDVDVQKLANNSLEEELPNGIETRLEGYV